MIKKRTDTLVPQEPHPALDVPDSERVAYLTVVASMAFADRRADEAELAQLRRMCALLELSDDGVAAVMAAAHDPDATAIAATLDHLRASDLRFALIVDAIDIAYTDGAVAAEEATEIEALAERLDIPASQVPMLRRYVAARLEAAPEDPDAAAEATAGAISAGIPAAGLAVATIAGAPVVAGVGVAAAVGAGSYLSVRWLLRRARRKQTPPPA